MVALNHNLGCGAATASTTANSNEGRVQVLRALICPRYQVPFIQLPVLKTGC